MVVFLGLLLVRHENLFKTRDFKSDKLGQFCRCPHVPVPQNSNALISGTCFYTGYLHPAPAARTLQTQRRKRVSADHSAICCLLKCGIAVNERRAKKFMGVRGAVLCDMRRQPYRDVSRHNCSFGGLKFRLLAKILVVQSAGRSAELGCCRGAVLSSLFDV